MIIGGEFYEDPTWQTEVASDAFQGMHFLNGGRACLTVIADYLLARGIRNVLLPEYLCPTILDVLERCGMGWEFYAVQPDFSVNLVDLAQKAASAKAIYFIHYFGFLQPNPVRAWMKDQQKKGALIIEDDAQMGLLLQPTGDFVFNSLRKFVPYDGGYLRTTQDVSASLNKFPARPNQRLPLIRAYRRGLRDYLLEKQGKYAALTALYQQAEALYEAEPVVIGDPGEQWQIEHQDWAGIRQKRRANYEYLMEQIRGISEITPLFPELQAENMPLGLPVFVKSALRDALFERLGQAGIGLILHWEEILTDIRMQRNEDAIQMAKQILTLPIDQRVTHKQMDYLVYQLAQGIIK